MKNTNIGKKETKCIRRCQKFKSNPIIGNIQERSVIKCIEWVLSVKYRRIIPPKPERKKKSSLAKRSSFVTSPDG